MKNKVVYLDKNHDIVEESAATWMVVTEHDEDGVLISDTWVDISNRVRAV